MLRIRLTRVGKKKQPHYRVVVADIEAPRDGRIVERIGYYSPLTESDLVDIDEERALYWLSVGAQPTDTVRSLLRKQGTLHRLSRLHAGEEMGALIAEYRQEIGEVEAEPAAAPAAAQAPPAEQVEVEEVEEEAEAEAETVVEEPATEVAEAYAEAEDEESVADEVAETAEDVVGAASEAVADAAEDALEAVEELIGSDEEE
jgi:small subunit ribosomal protein S16